MASLLILPDVEGEIIPFLHKILKIEEEGVLSNLIYKTSILLITLQIETPTNTGTNNFKQLKEF